MLKCNSFVVTWKYFLSAAHISDRVQPEKHPSLPISANQRWFTSWRCPGYLVSHYFRPIYSRHNAVPEAHPIWIIDYRYSHLVLSFVFANSTWLKCRQLNSSRFAQSPSIRMQTQQLLIRGFLFRHKVILNAIKYMWVAFLVLLRNQNGYSKFGGISQNVFICVKISCQPSQNDHQMNSLGSNHGGQTHQRCNRLLIVMHYWVEFFILRAIYLLECCEPRKKKKKI